MPHVVVEGEVSLEILHREFEPILERSGNDVIRVADFYLNHAGSRALLDCVVVEGRSKGFLLLLDRKPSKLTVRLYPPTDPEKSDGVRRLIALVARWAAGRFPGCRYGATNLGEFLIRDVPGLEGSP